MLYSILDCKCKEGRHWGKFEGDSNPKSDKFYFKCPDTHKTEEVINPYNSRAWSQKPPVGITDFTDIYLSAEEVKD